MTNLHKIVENCFLTYRLKTPGKTALFEPDYNNQVAIKTQGKKFTAG